MFECCGKWVDRQGNRLRRSPALSVFLRSAVLSPPPHLFSSQQRLQKTMVRLSDRDGQET